MHDDLPAISHKSEIIRPLSKSDEFSDPSSLGIEIWALKLLLFTKTYGTFWEPDPSAAMYFLHGNTAGAGQHCLASDQISTIEACGFRSRTE